jgi:2,3-bisphosphoglycerate-dependent phosphoglycerate mutase
MLEELFLVRHGAPDRSLNLPYALMPGPPLTARGEEEAVEAGAWLRGRGLERLFSSPFARAHRTAELVAEVLGLELTLCEALREMAPGERFEDARARVVEILPQLEDSPLRRVGLVTHGACVKALLLHTSEDRIDLQGHLYDGGNHAPTAGIWHGIRVGASWRWELAFRPALRPAVPA